MDFIVPSQVYGTMGSPSGQQQVTRITTGQVAVGAPVLIAAADTFRAQIHIKCQTGRIAVGGPGVAAGTGYILDAPSNPAAPAGLPAEVTLRFTGEIWADVILGKATCSFADEGY